MTEYQGPERRDLTTRGQFLREMYDVAFDELCEPGDAEELAFGDVIMKTLSLMARTYDEGRRAGQAQAVAELGAVVEAAVRRAMGKE